MFALFIAVLALIAYGSLYPWHFAAAKLPVDPLWLLLNAWPEGIDLYISRDVLVNVALYIPAGFTGHLAFRRFGKTWLSLTAPVLICAVFSGSIEMIQLFVPSRDTSALDLVTNIAGSMLGVYLAILLESLSLQRRMASHNPRRSLKPPDKAALILLAGWIVWLLFPLFPVMGRTELRQKLDLFLHGSVLDPVTFVSAMLAWFAAGNLLLAGRLRRARLLTAISVLLVPGDLFIVDRQPLLAAQVGAIAGAACFALLWRARKAHRNAYWKISAWVFLGVILIRGLYPFRLSSTATPFSWIPFGGFLNMDWQTGVQVIAGKYFWYGTAIWLMRKSGMKALGATALVATILLGIEIAQTRLPGYVAEITDPLWAIFASGTMVVVTRSTKPVSRTVATS